VKARLVGKPGEGNNRTKIFAFEEEVTLGRSDRNSFVVQDSSVSGEHARIRFDEQEKAYVLEDLNSLNGTQLDGTKVRGPEPLGRLHVITLARELDFIFQDLEPSGEVQPSAVKPAAAKPAAEQPSAPPAAKEKPATVAPAPDEPPAGDTIIEEHGFKLPQGLGDADPGEGTRIEEGGFKLPTGLGDADPGEGTRIEEGGFKLPTGLGDAQAQAPAKESRGFRLEILLFSKSYDLKEGDTIVGRSENADIRINMPDVSGRHAVISVVGGKVTVRDNDSSNKTYVGGREIGSEPVEVAPDTDLMFGGVQARLVRG